MPALVLLAASGLAREVVSAVEAAGEDEVVGFLDDQAELAGTTIAGRPVLGPVSDAATLRSVSFVVCAGRGRSRQAIVARLAALGVGPERYATVVDPTVRVPPGCSVGVGSVLLAQCVLTADVTLGQHVVAMPHVTLTHDDHVHDYATLCAGVTLGGSVRVGRAAYLGMGSSVRERVVVGDDATLGMGAVVLGDVPDGQTWAGCPARPLARSATAPLTTT